MNSMTESTQTGEQINDSINEQIVWDAQVALAHFHPETPDQVVDMLLFWRRRSELTEADIAEVARRMFPEELPLMDCPAWCETDHSQHSYNAIENLCEHDRDVLVERDADGRINLEVTVTATDDLTARYRNPAGVHVHTDEPLSADQAIRMVGAVSQALRILAGE